MIAFVDWGNSLEMISLILPSVFSFTQLEEEKKTLKIQKPDQVWSEQSQIFWFFALIWFDVNEPINVFRR